MIASSDACLRPLKIARAENKIYKRYKFQETLKSNIARTTLTISVGKFISVFGGKNRNRWSRRDDLAVSPLTHSRTQLVRNGHFEPDPAAPFCPLPFLTDVFMSRSAGHSSFSLSVCPSVRSVAGRRPRIANPPSSPFLATKSCR